MATILDLLFGNGATWFTMPLMAGLALHLVPRPTSASDGILSWSAVEELVRPGLVRFGWMGLLGLKLLGWSFLHSLLLAGALPTLVVLWPVVGSYYFKYAGGPTRGERDNVLGFLLADGAAFFTIPVVAWLILLATNHASAIEDGSFVAFLAWRGWKAVVIYGTTGLFLLKKRQWTFLPSFLAAGGPTGAYLVWLLAQNASVDRWVTLQYLFNDGASWFTVPLLVGLAVRAGTLVLWWHWHRHIEWRMHNCDIGDTRSAIELAIVISFVPLEGFGLGGLIQLKLWGWTPLTAGLWAGIPMLLGYLALVGLVVGLRDFAGSWKSIPAYRSKVLRAIPANDGGYGTVTTSVGSMLAITPGLQDLPPGMPVAMINKTSRRFFQEVRVVVPYYQLKIEEARGSVEYHRKPVPPSGDWTHLPDALTALAGLLREDGQYEEALAAAEEAVQVCTSESIAPPQSAREWRRQGDTVVGALETLGDILTNLGRHSHAATTFGKAHTLAILAMKQCPRPDLNSKNILRLQVKRDAAQSPPSAPADDTHP